MFDEILDFFNRRKHRSDGDGHQPLRGRFSDFADGGDGDEVEERRYQRDDDRRGGARRDHGDRNPLFDD